MQYFCMKTHMEMFDACRAYGLGLILNALKEKEDENVIISDSGLYYQIESPPIKRLEANKILPLFDVDSPSLNWKETFLTGVQRKVKGEIKPSTKRKITQAQEIICGKMESILKNCSTPHAIKIPFPRGETVLQSMDLSATKGYRVTIRSKVSYTEGSSLKVPPEEWALAVLGEAHLSIWKFGDGLVSIIPQPQRIRIMNWRSVRESLNVNKLNGVSVLATLSHTAVLLTQELRHRKEEGDPFVDKFISFFQ